MFKYGVKRLLLSSIPKNVCKIVVPLSDISGNSGVPPGGIKQLSREITSRLDTDCSKYASNHEHLAASVVTTYNVLVTKYGFEEEVVVEALGNTLVQNPLISSALSANLAIVARDPTLKVLTKEVHLLKKLLDEDVFKIDIIEEEFAVDVVVTRCFFNDYLEERNLSFLTQRTFCAVDDVPGHKLQSEYGSVHYTRPNTLPAGCTNCKFKFRSAQKSDDKKLAWT